MLPSVEPALAAARRYLCAKTADPSDLADFAKFVGDLKIDPAVMIATISRDLEAAHNAGRIRVDEIALRKKVMVEYALGHEARLKEVLRASIVPGPIYSELENRRREQLVAALGG